MLLKVSTEVGDSKSLTVPEIDGYTSSFFNLNCFSELETSIWKWKKYYGQHQFIKYWFDMEVYFFRCTWFSWCSTTQSLYSILIQLETVVIGVNLILFIQCTFRLLVMAVHPAILQTCRFIHFKSQFSQLYRVLPPQKGLEKFMFPDQGMFS